MITAIYLQLHEYPGELGWHSWNMDQVDPKQVYNFQIDFYLNSEAAFGIPMNASNYCGAPVWL